MPRSRYDRSRVLDGNHFETFTLEQTNSTREPDTFLDVEVFKYLVKMGDRLDHLAAKYLNEDRYWWVIALVNNMILPEINPGDKILIPVSVKEVLDRL